MGIGLKDARGKTLSAVEFTCLVADTLFPDDSPAVDTPGQAVQTPPHVDQLAPSRPPITDSDLQDVLSPINPKKVSEPDGLTADICRAMIMTDY